MSSIITFYSFKGGVGRTMALANIAVLLAQRGKRVLAVDWDLEAPGLDSYFADRVDINPGTGLLQLLQEGSAVPGVEPQWRKHVAAVRLSQRGALDLLPAGSGEESYARHLEEFDWRSFFSDRSGGTFVEQLRDEWHREYDCTLIDSRTGFTDSGGVCTILLPDVLVAVFSANEQSLFGVEEAIAKAQAGRQNLDVDRPPLLVVPLPSRFDGRVEVEEADRWTTIFTSRLGKYYDDWLPRGTSHRRVVERTRVPHVPLYAFGEKLPVLERSLTDPDGMGVVYDRMARLLADELCEADLTLLGERTDPATKQASEDLTELVAELEEEISSYLRQTERRERGVRLIMSIGLLSSVVLSALGLLLHEVLRTATSTAALAAMISCILFYFLALRSGSLLRIADIGRLVTALEELRLAGRLDRDRPELLREAYEKAFKQLRAAEGESAARRTSG
jgi:MinD-like ATPase involved in chromosome partitioning or flagellar assembly